MDPHFAEYLAAIAGMSDLYGEPGDDRPSEFHEVSAPAPLGGTPAAVVTPAASPVPLVGPQRRESDPADELAGSGIWTI